MPEPKLLDGTRVVDLTTDIAGPYCTKLLVDAGAEVVKVEPTGGDPLRRWVLNGIEAGASGSVLFQFLNAGKRSIVGKPTSPVVEELAASADLLVEDGSCSDERLAQLLEAHTELNVVSITPFGRQGPWRDRPWTEFTLQALAGSIAGRGLADREPLYAGGRLGEWIGGVYGAAAAAGVLHGWHRGRPREHADVSILEAMSVTMGAYGSLLRSFGAPEPAGPSRTVEVPSIEPTADGYVGFCTITAQQFADFLIMIERPDLLGDAELASSLGRQRRRQEFLDAVHAWSRERTTDEIVELAAAFRIPVSPIGRPETITTLEQFVARDVFVHNPGGFVQPRVPYRVDGRALGLPAPAPELGADSASTAWGDRREREARSEAPELPLTGVRILDLTAFWAGPSTTSLLAALGADVVKVESIRRPDGMRFSSTRGIADERWWEWSTIFHAVNLDKRGITLDLETARGRELFLDLAERSDVVVENFSPRVLEGFGLTPEVLHERNERLIITRMPAFGLDGPWRDRTGFAQTMEQASGMAWSTGFPDDAPVIPRGPCDPIAGTHAAFAIIAALDDRLVSGRGHVLESTMVESALNVAAEITVVASAHGVALARNGNRGPVAAPQGVYPCRGTDCWLALAVATDEQWASLRSVLGDPGWAAAPELQDDAGRRAHADRIDAELRSWTSARDRDELVEQLWRAGVPSAPVVEGRDVIGLPHLRERGFVETFDHPLIGEHDVAGVPFRFRTRTEGWFRAPAPMLGQHNRDVLGGLLGLDDEALNDLADAGVIGDRPAGL